MNSFLMYDRRLRAPDEALKHATELGLSGVMHDAPVGTRFDVDGYFVFTEQAVTDDELSLIDSILAKPNVDITAAELKQVTLAALRRLRRRMG